MSAVCDLALVLGLTLSGLCTPPPAPPPAVALPEDDEAAWSVPAPPEPPPEPPPPAMPPSSSPRVVQMPAPPPPEPPAQPPPPPPDPYRQAAQAVWNARSLARPSVEGSMSVYRSFIPPLTTPDPPVPAPAVEPPAPRPDYESDRRVSSLPVDNSRIVTTDRYITGVLETGINSQLDGSSGSVVIQVSRDVFGYHGRNLLIPKGSRLVCDYESPDEIGASRLAVSCGRVLLAEHRAEIIELASAAGDVQGRAGLTGEVDNRFGERYGTAFLLTGIATAVRFANTLTQSGDDASLSAQSTEEASAELSNRLGEITAHVLEQTLDLKPIITVPQGTRVNIRPATDWYIAEVE